MFLLREAKATDRKQLVRLSRILDSVNLPTDEREMREALERSQRSFRGGTKDRSKAVYIFCAEELGSGRLAGASMIIAKHGTPLSPHYYLEMDSEERYSHTLRKMFRHTSLRLRYSMDGPTEVGGLIVDPKQRGNPEKVGKQLSWVRFLYLSKHPKRFENRVLAEMMPPLVGDHGNVFWDHYGRRVTGLSFRDAERLSRRDKEFIRALFPESPLYTFMLPEEVRSSLAAVGDQSKGAVRLLEAAGMRFLHHIDPFDGGPYYGALVSDLEPVKAFKRLKAAPGEPADSSTFFLVARDDGKGFRAIRSEAKLTPSKIYLPAKNWRALRIKEDDFVDVVPLP